MKYLPKLTVRDLLWLIVVVAFAVLWRSDHQRVVRLAREVEAARIQEEVALQQQREAQMQAELSQRTAQQQYSAANRALELLIRRNGEASEATP